MTSPQSNYTPLGHDELPPTLQKKRSSVLARPSLWRFIVSVLLFLAGVIVGLLGLSAAFLFGNADKPPIAVPPSFSTPALVVQASSSYVNQIAQQKSGSFSGVPGTIKNIQVTFVHAGPVQVTGDDELSLFGLNITRHFSMQIQLYVDTCRPMVRVLHASFSGVPITGFVTSFEQNINQQLQGNITGLPSGFTYCMTTIQTEPQGATITFAAQPAP